VHLKPESSTESCNVPASSLPACGLEVSTVDKIILDGIVMVVSSPRNLIGGQGSQRAHVQRVKRVQQARSITKFEDSNRIIHPTKNTSRIEPWWRII